MISKLEISSPKRTPRDRIGFEGFYPYYAGFPESFAKSILSSADLHNEAVIFDPWNGSGTTQSAAAQLGFTSVGFDLNPVMVAVSRARLLPASEATSLCPLSKEIIFRAKDLIAPLADSDPLLTWFSDETAAALRSLERAIARLLVPPPNTNQEGNSVNLLSGIASSFYVAMFAVCRRLTTKFRSTNPTWIRYPSHNSERVSLPSEDIERLVMHEVLLMTDALDIRKRLRSGHFVKSETRWADATSSTYEQSVDLILSSPPYCTRLDYTAATRVELALLHTLVPLSPDELSRKMIGTTRVPHLRVQPAESWGTRCLSFLDALSAHSSKASKSYYLPTHVDYFDKMFRALERVSSALRSRGAMVLVVQDSFYKELHNDVPSVIADMAGAHGFELRQRLDFRSRNCMSQINPNVRTYRRAGSTEAVLSFIKA
jgi:hypothetical protein